MTDPLPPTIYAILFEGAPLTCRATFGKVQEWLYDVMEDDAERYQVWALDTVGELSADCTDAFVDEWAELFEPGSGDEPHEILRSYPAFVRAFIGDKIVAEYRAAQDAA